LNFLLGHFARRTRKLLFRTQSKFIYLEFCRKRDLVLLCHSVGYLHIKSYHKHLNDIKAPKSSHAAGFLSMMEREANLNPYFDRELLIPYGLSFPSQSTDLRWRPPSLINTTRCADEGSGRTDPAFEAFVLP
jgi:hypothetical protein